MNLTDINSIMIDCCACRNRVYRCSDPELRHHTSDDPTNLCSGGWGKRNNWSTYEDIRDIIGRFSNDVSKAR